jgi:hypothetical protein
LLLLLSLLLLRQLQKARYVNNLSNRLCHRLKSHPTQCVLLYTTPSGFGHTQCSALWVCTVLLVFVSPTTRAHRPSTQAHTVYTAAKGHGCRPSIQSHTVYTARTRDTALGPALFCRTQWPSTLQLQPRTYSCKPHCLTDTYLENEEVPARHMLELLLLAQEHGLESVEQAAVEVWLWCNAVFREQ